VLRGRRGTMGFNGSLIKTRAKETGYTLIQLSEELGVSARLLMNGYRV
jgi:lambda repressor-like predicted transcriptional regulator